MSDVRCTRFGSLSKGSPYPPPPGVLIARAQDYRRQLEIRLLGHPLDESPCPRHHIQVPKAFKRRPKSVTHIGRSPELSPNGLAQELQQNVVEPDPPLVVPHDGVEDVQDSQGPDLDPGLLLDLPHDGLLGGLPELHDSPGDAQFPLRGFISPPHQENFGAPEDSRGDSGDGRCGVLPPQQILLLGLGDGAIAGLEGDCVLTFFERR